MTPDIDIIELIRDPQLLNLPTMSPAQEVVHRAIHGLPLVNEDHAAIFQQCTGGREYRTGHRFSEATILAGARSGKDSFIAAPEMIHEALFGGHERYLARGERGVIPCIAQDGRAARVLFGFIKEMVLHSPLLASRVAGEPKLGEIEFDNHIVISVFPSTLRSTRGFSIPAGCLDEVAFYRLEGQIDSDEEIQASVRRGMLSFPRTLLLKISTPYLKSGILFDDYKNGFGQDNPDLIVWKASSRLMNPTLTAARLAREERLDPSRYAREYLAEFQDDLSSFLPAAWVDAAVRQGRYELPPRSGVSYTAAADPSGGGPDAFTFSIGHREGDVMVQDVIRGYTRNGQEAPNLTAVVGEIATTLRQYQQREAWGDRYAAGWVRQAFQQAGITYRESDVDRSRAFLECEPLFAQGRVELLDHPTQIREWKLLEKTLRPGGGATVTHPRSGHDDHANVFALVAAKLLAGSQVQYRCSLL